MSPLEACSSLQMPVLSLFKVSVLQLAQLFIPTSFTQNKSPYGIKDFLTAALALRV